MVDPRPSLLTPAAALLGAMEVLERSPLHFVMVVGEDGRLLGTVTDGDIRRALLQGVQTSAQVSSVMNSHPVVLQQPYTREDALAVARTHDVRQFPVVDRDRRVVGVEVLDAILATEDHGSRAVIMAGGLGSRLRPLTDTAPKALLPVGGKPVVEIVIEGLVAAGFRHVILCVNYLADLIVETIGTGARWDIEISYLRETEYLGTAGGLGLLASVPDTPLLVMNADVITRCSFRDLLKFHGRSASAATLCVRQLEVQIPYGVIRATDQRLTSIEEKPMQTFLANAGIYVLEPDVVKSIRKGEYLDMPALFLRLIGEGQTTSVFPLYEYWVDIGRHQDLQRANLEFRAQPSPSQAGS